jgi:hypothetical protein
VRGLAPHRRAYGPVRLWGSAAFIAANLAAGYLLDIIAARDLIWLVVAALTLCVIAGWALPPLSTRPSGSAGPTPLARTLLRDPAFIAAAAAASLIQGSHALYYSFSTIDWQAAGYGGGTIGMLWALGVLAEIVLFALSARLPAAFGPSVLIMIGGSGALLRWIAMALDRRACCCHCCNVSTGCRSGRRISAPAFIGGRAGGLQPPRKATSRYRPALRSPPRPDCRVALGALALRLRRDGAHCGQRPCRRGGLHRKG